MFKDGKSVLVTGGSSSDRSRILKYIAESAAQEGVPVFAADLSGRLSSLAVLGELSFSCTFWDLDAGTALPLRTTVSELGPLLLSKLLGLNDLQSELLQIIFKIADEGGLLLIDTKDLKALLNHVNENRAEYEKEYGRISTQSLSAILRSIALIETKGAEEYLFEPAIDVRDFLRIDENGFGRINIFDMSGRMDDETLYAVFTLYILSELNENLDEGDASETLSRLVFEVGSAEPLFADDSRSFVNKVSKLLYSLKGKGVTVVFAAENVDDIPKDIREEFEGEADAETKSSLELKSGDRLPGDTLKLQMKEADALHEKYKIPFDRDSAYEFLKRRGIEDEGAAGAETSDEDADSAGTENTDTASGGDSSDSSSGSSSDIAKRAKSSAKSLGSTVAGTVGRQLGKSIGSNFGSFGETLGGNIGASLGRGIMSTLFKE